ncbi:3-isopropylmalate dehydrogenase [Anaerotignum sp. MSJ-24]|uniref:3-isopropylmalate dehydrogenase n=1 Tax=Anaerotignum sp. MSJ-24 TaxID=2841521 RepID=UPI001C11DF9E|nr:3-isopropylmalate dehydrogenase [Anaerotignum sp. MSJ-24]MBU5464058.1 3-isopropylmalate dehydrogenase [Anaerotignum sp. MSJ-24]
MGNYNITVLKGDGIGPDIVAEAMNVLEAVGKKYNHKFNFNEKLVGGAALDACGVPLPDDTLEACKNCDSILLGAVGGPKWDNLPSNMRPEAGALLRLRKELGLYANLRPAIIHKALSSASPIKPEIIGDSLDILVVRELTGGIYFGERGHREGKYGEEAYDVEAYSEFEVKRIAKTAFEAAMKRNKRVTSIDKSNVLESSKLWRKAVIEVAKDYPEVELDHMYVDNAAMQLVRNPKHFDVIVTSNIFGDIISDEASQITGSIGMLPSASLSDGAFGMYEPIHGSAPDIAGMDIANPIATILSAGMMLRYSFGLNAEADAIEAAVTEVLDAGYRTPDIYSEGTTKVGTKEMGRIISEKIK